MAFGSVFFVSRAIARDSESPQRAPQQIWCQKNATFSSCPFWYISTQSLTVLSACLARLVEVMAICHHEAAVHQASAVAMTRLAEQTLVLEASPCVRWSAVLPWGRRRLLQRSVVPQGHRWETMACCSWPTAFAERAVIARREWPIRFDTICRETPFCKACMVAPWRTPLGTRWGHAVMSACVMTATTRCQAVVRDQDHND